MKATIAKQVSAGVSSRYLQTQILLISKKLRARRVLGRTDKEIVIAFVSSRQIRALNRTYRRKDRPTDVLSFVSDDPKTLGELVLAPEVILRQAKQHGWGYRNELTYMILHGVLHLLGYDHERSQRQAAQMFKIQDDVFEDLCNSSGHVHSGRSRRSQKRPRKSSR